MIRFKDLNENDLVWARHENPSFALRTEAKVFNRTCELAGFTERYRSNNIRKITLYSFRSFFFGKAADIHREAYAHKMIGHGGYLPQYDRMSDQKKLEWFLELEPELIIDNRERDKMEIEKLEEEKSELKKEKMKHDELANDFEEFKEEMKSFIKEIREKENSRS